MDRFSCIFHFCGTGLSRHADRSMLICMTSAEHSMCPSRMTRQVDAFEYLARTEGIICAIESAHAVAQVRKIAKNYSPDQSIIICLSGRGDKDVAAIARYRVWIFMTDDRTYVQGHVKCFGQSRFSCRQKIENRKDRRN